MDIRKEMTIQLLLVLAFLLSAHALMKTAPFLSGYSVGSVKQRLQFIPPPVPGISLDAAILGHWFVQYRQAPCSWSGSDDFTDFEDFFTRKGKSYIGTHTWRKEFCTTTSARFDITGPGTMVIRDSVGDTLSGHARIVAADGKNFVVWWICTKMSITGAKCDDPMLCVSTRARHPSLKLLNLINSKVKKIFGVTLAELPKMIHGAPCVPPTKKG